MTTDEFTDLCIVTRLYEVDKVTGSSSAILPIEDGIAVELHSRLVKAFEDAVQEKSDRICSCQSRCYGGKEI